MNTTTNEGVLFRRVFRFQKIYLMTDAVFVEHIETGF